MLYYDFKLDIIKNFFLILAQVTRVTKFFSKLISAFTAENIPRASTQVRCQISALNRIATQFSIVYERKRGIMVSNNQLPTTSAIILHCQWISAVLALNSSAMFLDLNIPEYLKLGWKLIDIDGTLLLSPLWNTDESQNKLGLLWKTFLQKCGCAKPSCRTKRCCCKSSGNFCSNTCSCNDCENWQVGDGDDKEEEDDKIQSASEDEDDDGELDYQEENDPFAN